MFYFLEATTAQYVTAEMAQPIPHPLDHFVTKPLQTRSQMSLALTDATAQSIETLPSFETAGSSVQTPDSAGFLSYYSINSNLNSPNGKGFIEKC